MVHAELALKAVLRVTAAVLCLAVVAVFMPREWMVRAHQWLRLGAWPEQPIVVYLARALSGMYALLGGLLWVISCDVRRYDGVLRYVALAWLALAVVVLFIGLGQVEPLRAYLVVDSLAAIIACLLMLLLRRRIPRQSEKRIPRHFENEREVP